MNWVSQWNEIIGFKHAVYLDEDMIKWIKQNIGPTGTVEMFNIVRDEDWVKPGVFLVFFISKDNFQFVKSNISQKPIEELKNITGMRIVFQAVSIEDVAIRILGHTLFRDNTLFLVGFENKKLMFRVHKLQTPNNFEFLMLGEIHCLNLFLDTTSKKSGLESLMFMTSKEHCFGHEQFTEGGGLGSWLLRLVDQLNIALNIDSCTLTDESTFKIGGEDVYTQCAYSKEHHGLSFYMSRFFLLKQFENLEKNIEFTNFVIHAFVEWWQEHQDTKNIAAICKEFPLFSGPEMIRYYKQDISLHTPIEKNQPAYFYLKGNPPVVLLSTIPERKPEDEQIIENRKIRLLFSRAFHAPTHDWFRPQDIYHLLKDLHLKDCVLVRRDTFECVNDIDKLWKKTIQQQRPVYNTLQLLWFMKNGSLYNEHNEKRHAQNFWRPYYSAVYNQFTRIRTLYPKQTNPEYLHLLQCEVPTFSESVHERI